MIARAKLQRFLVLLSLSAGWLLLISPAAQANSWPPKAVLLLSLPFIASIFSFGIGFILIILLEAKILVIRENLKFRRSVWLITVANLFSTLTGFGFSIALTGIPYEIRSFPGNNIFSFIFWLSVFGVFLGLGFCTAQTLKNLTKLWSVRFFRWSLFWGLSWSLLWVMILFGEMLLIDFVNYTNHQVMKLLAAVIYLSVGLFMSVVVEGSWLSRCLPEKSVTLGKTLVIANLRSYAYIVIPITIFLVLNKSE